MFSIYLDLFSQDLVAWAPTTNNLTEGESREHIITGVGGLITITDDGGDGISNIKIYIYDDNNTLQVILLSGSPNTQAIAYTGWKVVYEAYSGQGSGCMDGGVDGFRIDDDNGAFYANLSHCVKLAPMPITYQNHPTATVQNNQTQINWSVATQVNNKKYVIEHSNPDSYREALSFSPIGEITGDGTSNITKHYEYIHKSPSIGINYYRIKQVDYDGKYSYSDIASVRYGGSGETNIYPNPATSEVTITSTVSTSLQIMDVYGKVLSKHDISDGQNTINLSELPAGILIFVVEDHRYRVLKE